MRARGLPHQGREGAQPPHGRPAERWRQRASRAALCRRRQGAGDGAPMTRRLADLTPEQRERQRATAAAYERARRESGAQRRDPDREREYQHAYRLRPEVRDRIVARRGSRTSEQRERKVASDRAYYLARGDEIRSKVNARRAAEPEPHRASSRRWSQSERGKALHAAWVAARPAEAIERKRQGDRAYAAARPVETRAYKAAWYQAHRDAQLAKDRERHLADPERARRRANDWRHERPTRAAALGAAKAANRRAEAYGADGRLSAYQLIELWQRQPHCLGCGDGRGLDHIVPLSRGGSNTSGNIQNLCRSCNSRKGTRLPNEIAA